MPFMPYSIRGDDIYNESSDSYEKENAAVELSTADTPITYSDNIRETAFIGDTPFEAIIEGIETQFNDYISMEDKTNYVDLFYDQLHASYEAATSDTETFQDEIKEILDDINQKFIDKMVELFKNRLTLSITDIESESINLDELEYIFRHLYEFFILGARNNFKVAIANDVKINIGNITDPKEYFKTLRNMIKNYSPLITTFGPMEFLKYRGDSDIIDLFEDGKVVGNFLRKYSPKLYQNEEFEVELINDITMIQQIKQEVFNNGR